MKNLHTFEEFLNEAAIEIVDYSEVQDNWGNTKKTQKPNEIEMILKDPANFTDDMSFLGKDRNVYYIDDLISKEVKVGNSKFMVKENLNESTEPIGVAVYVKDFEDASGEGAGWTSAAQVDVISEDHLKSLKSQNLRGFKFFRKTRGSAPIVFRYTQELQKTIR